MLLKNISFFTPLSLIALPSSFMLRTIDSSNTQVANGNARMRVFEKCAKVEKD